MWSMWSSSVSSVISVTYLFVPFTFMTQKQVPITKRGADHDLDSVTALMVTDCHLQNLHRSSCSHGSILLLWMQRCLEVKCTLGMSLTILSSSASPRVVKYCPLATVCVIPTLEHSLIKWRGSGWFAFPCTFSLVRGVLFAVDISVGITMVSELFWATSFPLLSGQPEILQARHTCPLLLRKCWVDWRK